MDKIELYKAMDIIENLMIPQELLAAFAKALDVDTLEDTLAFIIRIYELEDENITDTQRELLASLKER